MNALWQLVITLVEWITGGRARRENRERTLRTFKAWVKAPRDFGYGFRQCGNCGAHIADTKLCGYCKTTGRKYEQYFNAALGESYADFVQLRSAPITIHTHQDFTFTTLRPGELVRID